jgi:hypothetical protein
VRDVGRDDHAAPGHLLQHQRLLLLQRPRQQNQL